MLIFDVVTILIILIFLNECPYKKYGKPHNNHQTHSTLIPPGNFLFFLYFLLSR